METVENFFNILYPENFYRIWNDYRVLLSVDPFEILMNLFIELLIEEGYLPQNEVSISVKAIILEIIESAVRDLEVWMRLTDKKI